MITHVWPACERQSPHWEEASSVAWISLFHSTDPEVATSMQMKGTVSVKFPAFPILTVPRISVKK